jgi:threonyl-tRNA synthetase
MAKQANERLQTIRHSMSHVMAEAVLRLFPGTQFGIGPAIEDGFYYDFKLPEAIGPERLKDIEKEMRRILASGREFKRVELSREEAKKRFMNQEFKLELIQDLPEGESISLYDQGEFADLCRGPHVASMKELNAQAFRLTRLAGAYWRGDEKRPMLTRIYAIAFEKPAELDAHLKFLEEVEKRDHRKLGTELDLFHLDDEDPGQIFWHPKGWSIYLKLMQYVREKIGAAGYQEVHTPFIMPQSLWERSGHWAKYRENMFITESEKRLFALKPMNCPGHIEIFKKGTKSYRDLPLRIAEFGSCTRNEASGALHGIMRVRGFVQDDAHIFCTEEQIASEIADFCSLLKGMYADFGFGDDKIVVKFSTRPEKRVGSDESWDRVEKSLADACEKAGLAYEIAPGEGAFYGPKLEFTLVDALGREWQCGTIQVDPNLPSKERLDATYVGEDGQKHHPVMLHRAVLGSLERFIGILIEHYSGAFPAWLCPEQAVVVPVAPTFNDYAAKVARDIKAAGFSAWADCGDERMNAKIRNAQNRKVPYMLVVGGKEAEEGLVAARLRDGRQLEAMGLDAFLARLSGTVSGKSQEL